MVDPKQAREDADALRRSVLVLRAAALIAHESGEYGLARSQDEQADRKGRYAAYADECARLVEGIEKICQEYPQIEGYHALAGKLTALLGEGETIEEGEKYDG